MYKYQVVQLSTTNVTKCQLVTHTLDTACCRTCASGYFKNSTLIPLSLKIKSHQLKLYGTIYACCIIVFSQDVLGVLHHTDTVNDDGFCV